MPNTNFIDLTNIVSTVIGTILATISIAGLNFLYKYFKTPNNRKIFFKRFIFYNNMLGLIVFTYCIFNTSFFPKWFSILIILLNIFNLSFDFENSIKEIKNSNNSTHD